MSEPAEDERLRRLAAILSLAYGAASLACLMWALIPEHRRRLMAMRLLAMVRERSGAAACHTGRQAMGLELSGCAESGSGYTVPYLLSLAREQAARAYERLRYS